MRGALETLTGTDLIGLKPLILHGRTERSSPARRRYPEVSSAANAREAEGVTNDLLVVTHALVPSTGS